MNEVRTYSSSQARAQWRDVLDLAAAGTDVVIERHGKPMVAVIAYDDYVVLRRKHKSAWQKRGWLPKPEGDGVDDEYH